ncbi:MAG: protein translocase subunit SecD [Fimbriimonadaceae bacterium]
MLVLTALSGWLFSKKEFSYGLDVDGGVSITYKLDFEKLQKGKTKSEARNQVIRIFERRASDVSGVVEATILPKGDDQITVELPGGVSLEAARKTMGSTAKIQWYWAKNLQTEKKSFRPYVASRAGDPDEPSVSFTTRSSQKPIEFYEDAVTRKKSELYQSIIKGWDLIIEGDELASAQRQQQGAKFVPGFTFSAEGAKKMERWCRVHQNEGENLAAVLDGRVISVAPLMDGAIISDSGVINGDFTPEYLTNFIGLLNSGSLPVPVDEIAAASVDPTIGKFALKQIVQTGLIAFGLTAVFLLVYYMFPGVVALVALLLYILFTLTVLKLANATFSLAAIAGFVLSIGMAVDANILVFERVKEEMREGRKLQTAIELGFKRAFPAILDSNACTIITSIVLVNLGTGPVKGFATTLIIGVLISLFTAVFVTRSLLMFLVGSGIGANPKLYGLGRQMGGGDQSVDDVERAPRPILEKTKLYFGISLLTIIPGAIFWAMGGIKTNVEFNGGYELAYSVPQDVSAVDISKKLEAAGHKGANVKIATAGPDRQAIITLPSEEKLTAAGAVGTIARDIGVEASASKGFQSVGSVVRAETIRNAILGVVISAALIIVYLAMRFGFALGGFVIGFRFAASVIIALIHDIFVVLGLAAIAGALMGWEVSALFISAMLTVIGFSTHDTIVIFDRIRENLRRPQPGEDLKHLMNRSITQSLARSIITSATVIGTLLLLVVMGSATPDLRHFNMAMLVGILSGTYSSIFNAAPILYLWDKWVVKKKGEEAGLMAYAKSAASRVRLTRDAAPVTIPTPGTPDPANNQSYGQVKRRQRANQYGPKPLDDEEI